MTDRYIAAMVGGDPVVIDTGRGAGGAIERRKTGLSIAHTNSDTAARQIADALNIVEHAGELAALDAASTALQRTLAEHRQTADGSSCVCGYGLPGDSMIVHVVAEWRDLLRATA